MSGRILLLTVILALASFALPMPEHSAAQGNTVTPKIVMFHDSVADPGAVAAEFGRAQGFKATQVYRYAIKGFAAPLPEQAIEALNRDPRVAMVSDDGPVEIAAQVLPTGVNRIDADHNSIAKIDGINERVNVDVAVLDTGIDAYHPDLRIAGGANCIGGSSSQDDHQHGTHVAGTIGALDNTSHVVGVAPGARLYAIKVLNAIGQGTISQVICGLDWVRFNAATIEVANMSIQGDGVDGTCSSSPYHQAICNVVAAGVTVVACAGNKSADANFTIPATWQEVITVSALQDTDGTPAGDTFFSSSNFGADIELAAPGYLILSTTPAWTGPSGMNTLSGTSMSAAHVSGAAALYIAKHGRVGPAAVKAGLIAEREQVHMIGDRDGIDEGIVNVNDGFNVASVASASQVEPKPTKAPKPTATTVPTATATLEPTPTAAPIASPIEDVTT